MTVWGAFLLVSFLVLGLSARFASRDPMRVAVLLIVLVMVTMRFVIW